MNVIKNYKGIIITVIVLLFLVWLILGKIVGFFIFYGLMYGIPIFFALWVFGTWIPRKLAGRKNL